MNKEVIISCQDLTRTFYQGKIALTVLSSINITIKKAEKVAIVGASGSGKSTLLHLMGGLDKPTAGNVNVHGQDISKLNEKKLGMLRNRHMGFVYQFHHLLAEFNALENVAMPLLVGGMSVEEAHYEALAILQRVGLEHRSSHRPGEMSGGERQRAAIARALVTKPAALLADEPTGNLDSRTAEQVFQLMLELNSEMHTSLVIVTHDHTLADRMERKLTLVDGKLAGTD